jgi:hypothetical protein
MDERGGHIESTKETLNINRKRHERDLGADGIVILKLALEK